ncbi:hypothetical protein [Pontibacter sp. G13]|uniref:hypothetical protein n=1 Tax=Pontibacter sp. G13 TaxID=3074898 RepID=UPI002889E1B5|nr:hypothetical protein [Pontibacter sp. G13]WNJ19622.1 hypothetical protein RJD25_03975 [Pontibacter sp. G13]
MNRYEKNKAIPGRKVQFWKRVAYVMFGGVIAAGILGFPSWVYSLAAVGLLFSGIRLWKTNRNEIVCFEFGPTTLNLYSRKSLKAPKYQVEYSKVAYGYADDGLRVSFLLIKHSLDLFKKPLGLLVYDKREWDNDTFDGLIRALENSDATNSENSPRLNVDDFL